MSQENIAKLSEAMSKLLASHGLEAGFIPLLENDNKFHDDCLKHAEATNNLLHEIHRKIKEESEPAETV